MKYLPLLLFLLAGGAHGENSSATDHYDANAEIQSIHRGIALQRFRDGVAFLNDHKYDDALNSFNACLQMQPNNASALNACGYAYAAKGDNAKALDSFDLSLRLRPDPGTYLNRGNLYRSLGRQSEAISDFTACLHLDKTNATAYLYRASAYSTLGKSDKALDDLSNVLALIPATDTTNTVMALVMRANTWSKLQKYDKAAADFEKAFLTLPSDIGMHNDYAWFLATCPDATFRKGAKAATLANLACDQTGWTQWQYIDTAAVALAADNQFDKAIACEQRVLQFPNVDYQSRKDIQARIELFKNHQPYHE